METFRLAAHPLHLGRGGTAVVQPEFTGGMTWYDGYGERHGDDGIDGRLVSMHSFSEGWDTWEVHPHGAEVVICIAGRLVLHQEDPDGSTRAVTLAPGEYAVNAPGVWHTADVKEPATAVFITSGAGTKHRPR